MPKTSSRHWSFLIAPHFQNSHAYHVFVMDTNSTFGSKCPTLYRKSDCWKIHGILMGSIVLKIRWSEHEISNIYIATIFILFDYTVYINPLRPSDAYMRWWSNHHWFRQAINWTNAGILLNGLLGTNFREISIKILAFSFKKIRLKVSSAKWRLFYLGLKVSSTVFRMRAF